MYETETNIKIEQLENIGADVFTSLAELRNSVSKRTVLPWSEHCTECVWPTCYSTCDLYVPRLDGRCRRFADGMVRVPCSAALNGYLLKIRFKRWAKLWAPGNLQLYPTDVAQKLERRDHRIGTALYQTPAPARVKKALITRRYNFKKRAASGPVSAPQGPSAFLVECLNSENFSSQLCLTIRPANSQQAIPFHKVLEIKPGFQRIRVPFKEISTFVNLASPYTIELLPAQTDHEVTLYFGLMEFVQEASVSAASNDKIKCVIWDLDNTLWDGVLIEDGAEALRLRPDIRNIIETLDRRGILNSIASKNHADEVLDVLKHFQLAEYFLCPQISWRPKSEAIKTIAQGLNIGIDTLLFVDDSEFELNEVRTVCPAVRVLNAQHYHSILELKECQVAVTAESAARRRMYQVEHNRQREAHRFGEEYRAFLAYCNIQLHIFPLTEENLERVHELTQRTNQMNFSGNRYNRDLLDAISQTNFLDTYVLSCEDRFGAYGIVGFGIVDKREPRLTDLMFSCRIQSKCVEHAFLGYILRKYIGITGRDFRANYRRTPRNMQSGRVFSDIGMQELEEHDGISDLMFSREREVPDDGLIQIIASENSRHDG